jgi:hypothetical protein
MAFDQPESRPAARKSRYPWRLQGPQQQDTPAAVQSRERAAASARTPAAPQPAVAQQSSGGMAVYTPPGTQGGYDAYAPPGARQNDLSGQVPSNQVYAQAFNQASEQVGSPNRATSYTMPGTATSRSLNPATGQYSEPQTRQSFDGNMAYNAIDNRPGPIQARATGIDGSAMPWQDALSQREAFTGGLVERLSQYQSGAATGRPDIDPGQLLNQANERVADGSFNNPFRAPGQPASPSPEPTRYATQGNQSVPYSSDVSRAVRQATPYTQGTQWQNPFGESTNIATPATLEQFMQPAPFAPGTAQPIPPQSQGTPYQQPAARGASRTPWR